MGQRESFAGLPKMRFSRGGEVTHKVDNLTGATPSAVHLALEPLTRDDIKLSEPCHERCIEQQRRSIFRNDCHGSNTPPFSRGGHAAPFAPPRRVAATAKRDQLLLHFNISVMSL